MRFLDLVQKKSLPQWARCYYDYKTFKLIISIGKKAKVIIRKMHDKQQQRVMTQDLGSYQNMNQGEQFMDGNFQQIQNIMLQANILFFKYHYVCKTVVFLFCQMKVHELNYRLNSYQEWSATVDKTQSVYLQLLSHVFYQGKMLYSMCQLNLEAYKKIQKKHSKSFQSFKLDSPPVNNLRIIRTIQQLNSYFDRLQTIYLMKKQVYPKKARDQLQEQMQENPTYVSIASYFFGLTNGISVSLLIVAVILFSYNNISVETNQQFKRDFPVWRGVSYMIMYMWIMSVCNFVFEKYKINFFLIMDMPKKTITASFMLSYSSFFTFIFMAFFVVYVMALAKIIQVGQGNAVSYFPLVVWGTMIIWLILPLPILSWQARLQFFKRAFLTLISPIYGSPIFTIWVIQQLISMLQPFQDFLYSVCYYTKDLSNSTLQDCSSYLQAGEIFGIIVFAYRFFQCIHRLCKVDEKWCDPDMFIAIRAIFNIILLVISFISLNNENALIAWYIFVGPIILFSSFVDMHSDWGLLWCGQRSSLLRNSLTYNKCLYYTIMIINFLLRACWVATLSPRIFQRTNIQASYFFFGIGIIELTRRLFWNLLKMQNLHIKNVDTFRIKTDYDQKQKIVRKEVEKQGGRGSVVDKFQMTRRKNELQNLKAHIEIKKQMRHKVKNFIQNSFNKLSEIQKNIEDDDTSKKTK